jgi:hypothetical protein
VHRLTAVDQQVAAAEAADRDQAEYFLQVLNERCVETDRRIVKFRTAMAGYESRGSIEHVRRCRRMIRTEEHNRHQLNRMIDALHRRFRSGHTRYGRGQSR